MKKIIITVLSALLLVCLVGVSFLRQKVLNRKYKVENETAAIGEVLEWNGFQMSVTGAKIWNHDGYFSNLGEDYMEYYEPADRDGKVIEVNIHIEKAEENDVVLALDGLSVQYDGERCGFNPFFAERLNPQGISFQMRKGASADWTIPFMLQQGGYTDEQWENIEREAFELVWTLHPVRREFLLEPLESMMGAEIDLSVLPTGATEEIMSYEEAVEALGEGAGKIYDDTNEATVDGFRYEVVSVKVVNTYEELHEDTADGYWIDERLYLWDMETGELMESFKPYFTVVRCTVRMTNVGDSRSTNNVLMQIPTTIDFSRQTDISTSEMYFSPYNKVSEKGAATLEFETGETKEVTTIYCVTDDQPNGFDANKLYYVINPFGRRIQEHDDSITYIKVEPEEERQ